MKHCATTELLLEENKGQACRMYRSGDLIDAHCLSLQPYSCKNTTAVFDFYVNTTIPWSHHLNAITMHPFLWVVLLIKDLMALVLFSPMPTNVMVADCIKCTGQYYKNAVHRLYAFQFYNEVLCTVYIPNGVINHPYIYKKHPPHIHQTLYTVYIYK